MTVIKDSTVKKYKNLGGQHILDSTQQQPTRPLILLGLRSSGAEGCGEEHGCLLLVLDIALSKHLHKVWLFIINCCQDDVGSGYSG